MNFMVVGTDGNFLREEKKKQTVSKDGSTDLLTGLASFCFLSNTGMTTNCKKTKTCILKTIILTSLDDAHAKQPVF